MDALCYLRSLVTRDATIHLCMDRISRLLNSLVPNCENFSSCKMQNVASCDYDPFSIFNK